MPGQHQATGTTAERGYQVGFIAAATNGEYLDCITQAGEPVGE